MRTEDMIPIINDGLEVKLRDVLLLKLEKLTQNAHASPESVDEEAIEQLRALGYVRRWSVIRNQGNGSAF